MALSPFDIGLIIIYFVIVFGIGLWSRFRESTGDYIIGSRRIGVFQTAASILAVLGGVILVGYTALAYDMGIGVMWAWVGFGLGSFFLGLAAPKIKPMADKHNFLTLSDYFYEHFDYKTGVLSAVITFFAFFAILVGQFIAGGLLFAPLLDIPYYVAVLILGFGTLVYLMLGGFKAIVKTDLLQFLIMILVFGAVLFFIDFGEIQVSQLDIVAPGAIGIVSFLLLGIFVFFGGADVWQRFYAANGVRGARNACFLAALFFVILGAIVTFVGLAARNNFPNIDPGEALYYGLFYLLPAPLLGVVVVILLAAIMSTIDTELFLLSSIITKDFIHRKRKLNDEQIASTIRLTLLILACVSMIIAIMYTDILTLLSGLLSLMLCAAPIVVGTFFWKIKKNAAFLSLLGSSGSFVYLWITGALTPDTAVITLPAAAVFLIIGQVIFRK
jgi:Na+/proline symporter